MPLGFGGCLVATGNNEPTQHKENGETQVALFEKKIPKRIRINYGVDMMKKDNPSGQNPQACQRRNIGSIFWGHWVSTNQFKV
jgi:hypothetical protein